MDSATGKLLGIFTGLIVVAIVALVLSKNAQTSQVVSAFTKGFASDLSAATGPITGGSSNLPNNLGIGG